MVDRSDDDAVDAELRLMLRIVLRSCSCRMCIIGDMCARVLGVCSLPSGRFFFYLCVPCSTV